MAFSLADRINKPTEKQRDFIAEIEEYVDDTFNGETRREASEWIDEHIDEYNQMRQFERGGIYRFLYEYVKEDD